MDFGYNLNDVLKFIINLVFDFIKTHSPVGKQGNGFAFVVHPRGYNDIISNIPFLKIFPRKLVIKIFPYIWPFTVSKIKGLKSLVDDKDIKGWVIGIPMLAHQIMENRKLAQKKISEAIKLAQNKGARVVGLGALTGSVTEGGAGLSKKGEIIITAGRAYTAYIIKSYIEDAIKRFGVKKDKIVIAIVGAAGGVGSAVTRLLIEEPFKKFILIDVERKLEKVASVLKELKTKKTEIEISHQISIVKKADIIITATNAPEAVIESDDVKPGTIIIDDAQPSDLSEELIKTRNDVIIIEAGVITAPGVRVGTNFRLANKNEIYSCLGEVMSLAASDWNTEYSAGNITLEVVYNIANVANKIGLKLAPYQAFGKLVSEVRTEEVRKIINNNHL